MRIRLSNFGFLWFLLGCLGSVHAQPGLWGMTSQGGEYGVGVIFSVNHNGEAYTVKKSFQLINPGKEPNYAQPTEFSNGRRFGAAGGGSANKGVVFEFDLNTMQYQKRADFLDGSYPVGKLVKVGSKLYGMTNVGGDNDKGTIYDFDPASGQITVRFSFSTATSGQGPYGGLTLHGNGKLYGVTYSGGANGYGTLFSFDPIGGLFTKHWDFGSPGGWNPHCTLLAASDGMLYGTAYAGGGSFDGGALFKFNPSTEAYTKLRDFRDSPASSPNGASPYGALIEASNGKFYGMTTSGGSANLGVLYSYDPVSTVFEKLVDLTGATTGIEPYDCGLVEYTNGVLYGAARGGVNNKGVLFEYNFLTDTFSKKHDFDGVDGELPASSMTKFSDGKLYGMTYHGGSGGLGVVYAYDPSQSSFTKVINFSECPEGSYPDGSLILASSGMFYGITTYGGLSNQGVFFEYDSATNTLQKLVDFESVLTGANPQGHLVQVPNGKIYGITARGGVNDRGAIFEFDPGSGVLTKKFDFGLAPNGGLPSGGLLLSSSGKLLGVTIAGGPQDAGTVFVFDPSSGIVTATNFAVDNGALPFAGLVETWDLRIFGTTVFGGVSDGGVLFEFDESSGAITARRSFPFTGLPFGGLTVGPSGKLYGLTSSDGTSSKGTLFEFDYKTSAYSTKINFDGPSRGSFPLGTMTRAANSKLYGMTLEGGVNNNGILFEFNAVTSVFTKKIDLLFSTGAYPVSNKLEGRGVDFVTGIHSHETVVAFPNPAKDLLELKGIGRHASNIRLLDSSGRSVEIESKATSESLVLDVRNLSPGIYVVLFSTGSGRFSYRFVKN